MGTLCYYRCMRIEKVKTNKGPYDQKDPEVLSAFASHSLDTGQPSITEDTYLASSSLNHLVPSFIEYLNNKGDLHMEVNPLFLKEFKFAFRNLYQLKSWFSNEDLKLLHDLGYNLVVYKTDRKSLLVFNRQLVVLDCQNNLELLWRQNLSSLIY